MSQGLGIFIAVMVLANILAALWLIWWTARGSGKVAGLGFYVDPMTRMRSSRTLESAPGFLGVFAHFQLVMINLQSGAIEAHQRVVVGTTYAAADAPDRTPWNALSSTGKTRALASLMRGGIERWLPGMLTSQKP